MYFIESVLLHFTINDYMTVACGLHLTFSLEKIRVEREMFQLCNYLLACYFFLGGGGNFVKLKLEQYFN